MKRNYFLLKPVFVLGMLIPCFSFGQEMTDETTFTDAQGRTYKVGDDLIIGEPSASSGQFRFIISTSEKKLGLVSKMAEKVSDAGRSVADAAAEYDSKTAYAGGRDVSDKASSASEVTEAGKRLLSGNHELTGQNLRILRFSVTGNEKRGERFYAIVAGPGKGNYEVEIIPAINAGELAGINGELFAKENSASN